MLATQLSPSKKELEAIQAKAKRLEAYQKKTAAFREWQRKLGRKDTLPRGRFFRNKSAGRSVLIIDECHLFYEQLPMNSYRLTLTDSHAKQI